MKVTRIKQSLLAVVIATGTVAGTTALFTSGASASYPLSTNCGARDCGSASAFGVEVQLGASALIPQTPEQNLPTGGGPQTPANAVSLPLNPLLTANALSANAYSTGTFGAANEQIQATAAVSGLTTEVGISLLNTIEANAVTTSCVSNAQGSVASANFLGLNIAGMAIPNVVPVNDVLPSSELGPLAPLLSITLNAQSNTVDQTGQTGITVDGIVITLLGTIDAGATITVAQSVCEANGPDILPTPIVTPAPQVTSVVPASGGEAGNQGVVINGLNLGGATAVDFGPGNAATITSDSATVIDVTDPPGNAGPVDVTVTTAGGTSADNPGDIFTYEAPVTGPPVVTSISPTQGPNTGGTTVTINGSNLGSVDNVDFGANNPATILSDSATQITVTDPTGTGTVNVTVTTPSGTSATSAADEFTYTVVTTPLPVVTGISPTSGPSAGGTLVTINGNNLENATSVVFGAAGPATIVSDTTTQITVDSPPGTPGSVVNVVVRTPGGSSATSAADEFTYNGVAQNAPTISSTGISPLFGPTAGGTLVTILGTNFEATSGVTFGTTPAATVTYVNSGELQATTKAAAAGPVNVIVSNGALTATAAQQFTFVAPPTCTVAMATDPTPATGPITGGTVITITGTGFAVGDTASVTFGTLAATNVQITSSTTITAVAPAEAAGTVSVAMTDSGGPCTSGSFTYINAPVTVTGINPNYGPTKGGTSVVITGNGFASDSTVTFGTTPAASFTYTSGTSITAVSPPGTAGIVDVTVNTPSIGTSPPVFQDEFTYVGQPSISSTGLNPTSGPTAGGTLVTITGSGFGGPTQVTFDTSPATDVTVVSFTEVTAVTPAHAVGAVPVTLSDTGGSVIAPQQYTYTVGPSILGISPTSGPQAGGETVIIGGQNLCGATSVTFGPNAATILSISTDCTTIKVTEPAGNGTVPVTVTTGGGSVQSPIPFTYIQPGYWMAASDGGVFAFGGARFLGSVPGVLKPGQKLNSPIVAMADTPDHGGYWLFAGDGGVFAFGDAAFYGSVPGVLKPGQVLNGPIVAAEATPDGHGYREFAADGGVFDFGDAVFTGSLPGEKIIPDQPITAAVSTPIGQGYWLTAQDGGVFTFGNAVFNGSAAGQIFGKVVSMATTPDGLGYYIFLTNGAVAVEGDAISGLGGAPNPVAPIVFGQTTSTGQGYWEFASDGGVFTFGDAPFVGSLGGTKLNAPITAGIAFGANA
jgi:hypothetical protein